MTLPVEINPLLLVSNQGYQISRSVRLRSSASAFFSRTPTSAGNRTTWTLSFWHKLGTVPSTSFQFFSSGAAISDQIHLQNSTNLLRVYLAGAYVFTTPATFRDPSAWYHFVVTVDTTQATAANRVRVWVNGVAQTSTDPAIAQNTSTKINDTGAHFIGRYAASSSEFLDGYLTEVNFIDGQALTPAAFGETNPVTGVWQPRRYTGTYGTNGFYLNFSDPSAGATGIGRDSSGQGNNWTPNNISLTLGATYDSMLDVPTNWADGGNGRGNYCTLNPIGSSSNMTITGGNLNVTSSVAVQAFNAYSTIAVLTGKWYAEATVNTGSIADMIGVCPSTLQSNSIRFDNIAGGVGYASDGRRYIPAGSALYGATYASGDVIGIALDMDAQAVTFYKNGVSQGTLSSFFTANVPYYFVTGDADGSAGINQSWNFGQRPFSFSPPTGFRALNTQNLPEPLISNGRRWMDASLYTGNNTGQTVTNSAGMQPDLLWIKARSNTYDHVLADSVRGVSAFLSSNTTAAEGSNSELTSFNSNGFTLGATGSMARNVSGQTYVGWQWKEGAQAGFDIVTATSTTGGVATFNHNLGVAPAFALIKGRSVVEAWPVYHRSIGTNAYLVLNTTSAQVAFANLYSSTSTQFVHNSLSPSANYVAYLFAEVPGFSRFGSYTGNGSADGPFVHLGFRARWIMVKRVDATQNWAIIDTERDTSNIANRRLFANLSSAEDQGIPNFIDVTANGFKCRDANVSYNASGGTYIFAAFAENPFKHALAR